MAKKVFSPSEFLSQLKRDENSLDRLQTSIAQELGNNSQAAQLIESSQRQYLSIEDLVNSVVQDVYEASQGTFDVQILYDDSNGVDKEIEIRYVPNKNVYEFNKEIEKILPKFHISLDDNGLGTKNGLRSINQKTLIYNNGKYGLITKNEYNLMQQKALLENKNNNVNKNIQRILNGQKGTNGKIKLDTGSLRALKNGIAFVDKQSRNGVAAVSNFKELTEDARKALQGTGSALSTAIRKNYYDIYPAIHSLVQKNNHIIADYKKKRENYYKSYDRAREEVEQQMMELISLMSTPSGAGGKFKPSDYVGNKSKYSHFNDARVLKDIQEIAQIFNEMGVYIGTSQESSIKNFLVSLTRNSDLGIFGGLDDPSSRKRVQVSNTSKRKLTKEQQKTFESITDAAPLLTQFMKKAGVSHNSQEMRMYSGIQASQKEITDAIRALKEGRKISDTQAKRLLSTVSAQDGALFISDRFGNSKTKNVAGTFTSAQTRTATVKKADIDELLKNGKVKSKSAAIEKILARENDLSIKEAHKLIHLTKENIEKENGDLVVYYEMMQRAEEAQKVLAQADYGRYSATFVTQKLMERILENRGIKNAKDYINSNKLTLIKPTEGLSYRNFSGNLESYVNNYLIKAKEKQIDLSKHSYFGKYIDNQGILKKEFINNLGSGQDKFKELRELINNLNGLNLYNGKNPLSINDKGEIVIDTRGGIFSTPLSLFDTYEYGDPGNVIKADYRLQGATKRFLNMAATAAYSRGDINKASGFQNLAKYRKNLYDLESKEGKEKYNFYKKALNNSIIKTKNSANADWRFSKNDLIMSYGITPDMQKAAAEGHFKFVPIKPGEGNKPLKKNEIGYIDLSGDYADIDYEKGFNKEGLNGTIWDAILKSGKTNIMYLPEEGLYAMDENSGKSFKARGIYLPELMSDFAKQYQNGETLDLPTFMINNVSRIKTAENKLNIIREFNKNNPIRDVKSEQDALEELKRVQLEILAEASDDITTKNGSVYQSQYARMSRSTLRKASSVSTGFEDLKDLLSTEDKELLESNALMNKRDIFELLAKNNEESLADYYYVLKQNFDYIFQDIGKKELGQIFTAEENKFLKSLSENSDAKDLRKFKELIVNSITADSKLYKRIKDKGLLGKMHGIASHSIRFPLSEGMDEKTVELFGGTNNLIGQGAIRVGHGIAKQYNADYDGDKLGLYLAFSRGELLRDKKDNQSLIQAQNEAKKISQRMAQISAYYDISGDKKVITKDGNLVFDNEELLQLLNGDQAFDVGAVASRINKFYTGKFSNRYQTVTEGMDALNDPNLISGANRKDLVGQMVIRAMFESMTQDAISAKKVTKRILDLHGEEAFGAAWTKELDSLYSTLGNKKTYTNGIDNLYNQLKHLGILGAGEEGFSGRVGASLLGKILEIYNYNVDDIKKDLGLDESILSKMRNITLDKNGKITEEGLNSLTSEKLFSEQDIKTLANSYLDRHPNVIPNAISKQGELIHTGSALYNPVASLGGELLTQEEFDKLSPELQKLAIKYDELANQTLVTADAVNKEADAEARKIKIAEKEISVISKATKAWQKYSTELEKAKDYAHPMATRKNALRVLGQQEVASNLINSDEEAKIIKQLSKRGFDAKKEYQSAGWGVFESFKNLKSGKITENIAASIFKAQELGLTKVKKFKDIEKYLNSDGKTFKDGTPLSNKDVEFYKFLYADGIDTYGYYGVPGAYDDRLAGLGTLLNKYKKPLNTLDKHKKDTRFNYKDMIRSGEEMAKLTLTRSDNSIDNIVSNEQILNGFFDDRGIYGWADLITASKDEQGRTTLNILDLKNSSSKPTGEYAMQVYTYKRMLQQLQEYLIKNKIANADQFFNSSDPEIRSMAQKFRNQFGEQGVSDNLIKILTGQRRLGQDGKWVEDNNFYNSTEESDLQFRMGLIKAKNGKYQSVDLAVNDQIMEDILMGRASEEVLEKFREDEKNGKLFKQSIGDDLDIKDNSDISKLSRAERIGRRETARKAISDHISEMLELRGKINDYNADIARTEGISDPNLRKQKQTEIEAELKEAGKKLELLRSKLQDYASTDRKLFGGTNEWKNNGPLKELFSGEINDSAIDKFIEEVQNDDRFKDLYSFKYLDYLKSSEKALGYARDYQATAKENNKRKEFDSVVESFKSKGELEYLLQNSTTLSPIEKQEIKAQLDNLKSQISNYTQKVINDIAEDVGVSAENVQIEDLTAAGANAAKIKEYQRRKKSTKDISSYYKNLGAVDVQKAILEAQHDSGKITDKEYAERKLDLEMEELALNDEHNAWLDVNNSSFSKEEEERLKKNYLDNKDANIASGLSKYNRSELAQERAVQREIRGIYDRLLSTDKDIYGLENQLKREPNQNKKELIQEKLGLLKEQRGDILGEINNKKGLYGSAYEGYFDSTKASYDKKLQMAQIDYDLKQKTERSRGTPTGALVGWMERMLKGGLMMRFAWQFRRMFHTVINQTKELDKAMTNLRIVTGSSEQEARNMMSSYSKLGQELGATTIEITNSANEWLNNLGHNINPSNCWKVLKFVKLQHKNEISLNAKVKNLQNWIISSEVPNRETFNDYYVETSVSKRRAINILLF